MRRRANSTALPTVAFVMPYVADYRVGFFERFARESSGRVVVIHPRQGHDPAVSPRTLTMSQLTPDASILASGRLFRIPTMARQALSLRARTVVVEAETRCVTFWWLIPLLRLTGHRVVVWGLGTFPRDRTWIESTAGSVLTRWFMWWSHAAIGKGDAAADYYGRRARPFRRETATAPNSTALAEVLVEAKWADDGTRPPRLLLAGRLVAMKRFDLALDAAEQLYRRGHDIAVDLVGSGPEEATLRRQAESLGVPVRCASRANAEELRGLLGGARMVLMPGSGGLIAVEALAAGKPLVLGPNGATGDSTVEALIEPDITGYYADGPDAADFAAAIERALHALEDEEARAVAARSCRESYRRFGGVEAMVSTFREVCRV